MSHDNSTARFSLENRNKFFSELPCWAPAECGKAELSTEQRASLLVKRTVGND